MTSATATVIVISKVVPLLHPCSFPVILRGAMMILKQTE
jgi:hypothetical protein